MHTFEIVALLLKQYYSIRCGIIGNILKMLQCANVRINNLKSYFAVRRML